MTTDERIENLEKGLASARRLNRWLLAAVGLALGVWILAGTFGPRTAGAEGGAGVVDKVRAKNFVLVDDAGKPRAMLCMDKDGAMLGLSDKNGNPRAMLSMGKEGPMLGLVDENGKDRATLAAAKGGSMLSLSDENGKTRAMLGAFKEGTGLVLYDEKGKAIWQAP